jgi:hypothetical protein
MTEHKKKTGVHWFKRKHYDKLRRTFLDGHTFPSDFDAWLREAQAKCEKIVESGRDIVRVEIEPDEFVRWCKAHRCRTDADGRDSYIKLMTYRIAMGTHAPFVDAG